MQRNGLIPSKIFSLISTILKLFVKAFLNYGLRCIITHTISIDYWSSGAVLMEKSLN